MLFSFFSKFLVLQIFSWIITFYVRNVFVLYFCTFSRKFPLTRNLSQFVVIVFVFVFIVVFFNQYFSNYLAVALIFVTIFIAIHRVIGTILVAVSI